MRIADIAKRAFDAVAAKIEDSVIAATLTRTANDLYNDEAGQYWTSEATQSGRVVVDGIAPARDIFPEYVIGPADELVMLQGFTSCAENDELTYNGATKTVMAVQDIAGAGTLFYAIVR